MTFAPENPGSDAPTLIGWREWASLPELGISRIKVKVDTGARTSALHAFSVETYVHDNGEEWVKFGIHPQQYYNDVEVYCNAPVLDKRLVRDSGGHQTERIVIATDFALGEHRWPIELTLTARDDMMFRMLLGRTAMRGRFAVDPARSYMLKSRRKRAKQARPE